MYTSTCTVACHRKLFCSQNYCHKPTGPSQTQNKYVLTVPVIFVNVVLNDGVPVVSRDLCGDVNTFLGGQEVDPQQRVILQGLVVVEETLGKC